MSDAPGASGGPREPVGSAREEAARLLEALTTWVAGARGSAFAREHVHEEGIATGSAECRLCPICSAISALRGVRPDVVEHLLDAGGSLLAALRAGLEPPAGPGSAPPGGGPPAGGSGRVERIDVG